MFAGPAVLVCSFGEACAALAPGRAVSLLSMPGAASFAGAAWWRGLVAAARTVHPATPCSDILDCDDAPGRAMEALRLGQRALVLDASSPGFAAVAAAAAALGAMVLPAPPPARSLAAWLANRPAAWADRDKVTPLR